MGFNFSNNLTSTDDLARYSEEMEVYEAKFDAAMDILGYSKEDKAEIHMARDDASLCGNHMALKSIKLSIKNEKALKFLNDVSVELEKEHGKNSRHENALAPWSNVVGIMVNRAEENIINKAMLSVCNLALITYNNLHAYQRQN